MNQHLNHNENNPPTYYKLTVLGRIIFFILVTLIVAAAYFAVEYFVVRPPSDGNNMQIENNNPNIPDQGDSDADDISQNTDSDNDTIDGDISSTLTSDAITENLDSAVLSDVPAVKTSVYFAPESSVLTDDAKRILNKFIEENGDLKHYLIVLEGNCATTLKEPISEAAKKAHLQLAQSRANAVKDYLAANMLDEIEVRNLGSENPDNDNSTFAKRISNRRVDIYLYKEKVT